MKRYLLFIIVILSYYLSADILNNKAGAQSCGTGGCTSAAETNQYPPSTFSTSSSSWSTVSADRVCGQA